MGINFKLIAIRSLQELQTLIENKENSFELSNEIIEFCDKIIEKENNKNEVDNI